MSSRPDQGGRNSRCAQAACLVLLACGPACAAPPAAATTPTVTVTGAWARATVPGQDSGVVYLTLTASADDTLRAASSPDAATAMLHRTTHASGMSGMADMDGLALPAGRPVALAPNAAHIMLGGLRHRLVAGGSVALDLTFAHAPALHLSARVAPIGAIAPPP